MTRRLVLLTCRMRHLALWWGPFAVVLLWPLASPMTSVPLWSVTTPRQSGGTLAVRFCAVLFVWQGGRAR